MAVPPLPPGFVLETDQPTSGAIPQTSGIPPLPPGFQMEAPSFANVQSSAASASNGPAPSRMDTELRGIGLGARSVLQGVGGLVGAVGGDAFNYLMPGDQPSYRDAAGMLADRIGLPSPQNATERVRNDVGEAVSGTALTLGAGGLLNVGRNALSSPSIAQRASNILTAQPGLQAVSAATGAGTSGTVREAGGSQGQQLAAGLAGSLAPGGLPSVGAAATRGLVRGRDAAGMQSVIDDFASIGATPSVGQASRNWMIQGGENVLGGGPTSAGVINRFAEGQAEDIGEGLQAMGTRLAPNASAERAGRAIESGADLFKKNTGATKAALYWQADQFLPAQKPVSLQNTWQQVVKLTTPTPGVTATTEAMIQPTIKRLRDTLQQDIAAGGGQIPYEGLKKIRTEIGEAISNSSPLNPTSDIRELRSLYAALSRDMEAAAQSAGPEAVRAARRANNYTRAVADRMEQVARVVDKNGGPEKVYAAATAGTRDGGTTLRAVMQSLPPEGQRMMTAATLRRMGMANPGAQDATGDVFSANTFLTNWNKVSPEAKRALFDRHGPQFSQNMDRVARVAANIKDGSKVLANPSGTANRAAAITYGATLAGSVLTGQAATAAGLAAAGVGANLVARALTNPAAVKWLARTTTLPAGSIPAALNAMRTEGEKQEDQDLIDLAEQLEQAHASQSNSANGQGRP